MAARAASGSARGSPPATSATRPSSSTRPSTSIIVDPANPTTSVHGSQHRRLPLDRQRPELDPWRRQRRRRPVPGPRHHVTCRRADPVRRRHRRRRAAVHRRRAELGADPQRGHACGRHRGRRRAGRGFSKAIVALAPPTSPPNAAGIQVLYVALSGTGGAPDPVGLFLQHRPGRDLDPATSHRHADQDPGRLQLPHGGRSRLAGRRRQRRRVRRLRRPGPLRPTRAARSRASAGFTPTPTRGRSPAARAARRDGLLRQRRRSVPLDRRWHHVGGPQRAAASRRPCSTTSPPSRTRRRACCSARCRTTASRPPPARRPRLEQPAGRRRVGHRLRRRHRRPGIRHQRVLEPGAVHPGVALRRRRRELAGRGDPVGHDDRPGLLPRHRRLRSRAPRDACTSAATRTSGRARTVATTGATSARSRATSSVAPIERQQRRRGGGQPGRSSPPTRWRPRSVRRRGRRSPTSPATCPTATCCGRRSTPTIRP